MKLLESNVSLLIQGEGLEGLNKHVERLGRLAYKSEDKITGDSYVKFNEMIKNRGHWAVFDSGTVYLVIPDYKSCSRVLKKLKKTSPYTRWNKIGGKYYITTTYRVILKNKLESSMVDFWSEPTKNHKMRVTFLWTCSRGTAFQAVRHRAFSFIMESTRYCNYSKNRFGGELSYIIPEWVERAREYYVKEEGKTDLEGLGKVDLWRRLICLDRTIAAHNDNWVRTEEDYIYETTTDEGFKLRAEEARGILGNDLKCVLAITGYIEDFRYTPEEGSPEKAGFFYLRTAQDAQIDIRVLAEKSKKLLENYEQ